MTIFEFRKTTLETFIATAYEQINLNTVDASYITAIHDSALYHLNKDIPCLALVEKFTSLKGDTATRRKELREWIFKTYNAALAIIKYTSQKGEQEYSLDSLAKMDANNALFIVQNLPTQDHFMAIREHGDEMHQVPHTVSPVPATPATPAASTPSPPSTPAVVPVAQAPVVPAEPAASVALTKEYFDSSLLSTIATVKELKQSVSKIDEHVSKLEPAKDNHNETITTEIKGLKTEIEGLKTDIAGIKNSIVDIKNLMLEARDHTERKRFDYTKRQVQQATPRVYVPQDLAATQVMGSSGSTLSATSAPFVPSSKPTITLAQDTSPPIETPQPYKAPSESLFSKILQDTQPPAPVAPVGPPTPRQVFYEPVKAL